ncbi:MAG: hypothetical protein RR426_00255 [Oscillospiraceae bacterium]
MFKIVHINEQKCPVGGLLCCEMRGVFNEQLGGHLVIKPGQKIALCLFLQQKFFSLHLVDVADTADAVQIPGFGVQKAPQG